MLEEVKGSDWISNGGRDSKKREEDTDYLDWWERGREATESSLERISVLSDGWKDQLVR